ncbi:MAG: outer membrane beta-barrel protein [Bacteroidota bacterium]
MSYKNILIIFLYCIHYTAFAQQKDSLHLSFYFDGYVSWIPSTGKASRPAYMVNYTGLNSAGINFLSGNLHYRSGNFRTTLGAMAGEYAQQNLISEKPWVRNIYEANIGYRITSKEDIWLDLGVLPSHIGLESVPGMNSITATRNIISDITPYYETGIRLSYTPNDQWYFAILSLNGWQRITAPIQSFGKNWGMQISYRPVHYFLINSSSFIGEVPGFEKIGIRRLYSNLFSTIDLNPRMSVSVGWDWGMQGGRLQQWNDFLFLYRYIVKKNKLSLTSRYEWFSDQAGLFMPKIVNKTPQHHLTSLNIDYQINQRIMLRTEMNYLFTKRSKLLSHDFEADNQLSFFFILSARLDYKK